MRVLLIVALTGCSVHRSAVEAGGSEDTGLAQPQGTDDGEPREDASTTAVDSTGSSGTPEPPAVATVAPMLLQPYGVFLEVSFGGAETALLRYDTGAPTTYLDADWAVQAGVTGGMNDATIGEVEIGSRAVTLTDWIEADFVYPGLPSPVLGLVGNDFFAGHAVGLHYAASELWVYTDVADGATLQWPPGVDDVASTVTFTDRDGYLVVDCTFDATVDEAPCLFDTGAVFSVAYAHEWAAVDPLSSDSIPATTFDNEGNTLLGSYQRAPMLMTGSIELAAEVVAVLPQFELLDRVGEHLGLSLRGLVGMHGTVGHFTVIDYVASEVRLHRYAEQDPLWSSPFVGYGLTVAGTPDGGLAVSGVVEGSKLARAGVQAGDRLVDASPGGLGALDFTIVGLVAGTPGQTRTLSFQRDGEVQAVEAAVADWLPLP